VGYPVYSRRLFTAPSFSGGPTVLYTPPAGFVAVIKTISMVWGDISVSELDAWLQYDDLTKLVRHSEDAVGDIDTCIVFDGSWVVEPGQTIAAQAASGTLDIHGSGYELTLP
jgi:hypothetical protein